MLLLSLWYPYPSNMFWYLKVGYYVAFVVSISFSANPESSSVTNDDSLYPRPRLPPISFPGASSFTVYSSTQNLPAILNDPRLLKRQTDFFIRTWGDDFIPQEVPPLTLLPSVPKIYFDDYLKKIDFVSNPSLSHYCQAIMIIFINMHI